MGQNRDRMKIMDLYRAHPELNITQLRLGRLYAEEQKGRLKNKTEDELIVMLGNDPEQVKLDEQEMGQIRSRQE